MKTKLKYLATTEIKEIIDKYSDDEMADWGEWFIGMAIQYYLEDGKCNSKVLIQNIFHKEDKVEQVMNELSNHIRFFMYQLSMAGVISDFHLTNTGVLLEVVDEKTLY